MRFCDYETGYDFGQRTGYIRKDTKPEEYLSQYTKKINECKSKEDQEFWMESSNQMDIELKWRQARKPYYSVYPSITKALVKTRLDIPNKIKLPLPQLLLRFSKIDKLFGCIKNILAAETLVYKYGVQPSLDLTDEQRQCHTDGITLFIDYGEKDAECGQPIYTSLTMPNDGLTTFDQAIEDCCGMYNKIKLSDHYKNDMQNDISRSCLKIVVACCLLHDDPDLFLADVLNKDADKYNETGDQKYIDKAHRRGKVGWTLGKTMEKSPHFRRAHFSIRWTGEGRKIPKLTLIKSSIVHREIITKVPTGTMF